MTWQSATKCSFWLILQACYLALHLGGHVCGPIKAECVSVYVVFSAAPTNFRATLRFSLQQRFLEASVNSTNSTAHLRQSVSLCSGIVITMKMRGGFETNHCKQSLWHFACCPVVYIWMCIRGNCICACVPTVQRKGCVKATRPLKCPSSKHWVRLPHILLQPMQIFMANANLCIWQVQWVSEEGMRLHHNTRVLQWGHEDAMQLYLAQQDAMQLYFAQQDAM